MEEQRAVRYEVERKNARGELIVIDFALKPILGPDGKVVMLLPEGYDITQRKRTEEALKRSQERYDLAVQGCTRWHLGLGPG